MHLDPFKVVEETRSKKDNVWLAGRLRKYNGTETPTDADDAFLIPGFPKTDKQFHQRKWQ